MPNEEPDEATGSYQGEVQTSNFIIAIVKRSENMFENAIARLCKMVKIGTE